MLWESEFDNIVSDKDKVQDLKINQLKLEIHDIHEKEEKITTDFEPINDEDVINKTYLDEKILNINGHLSIFEKDYNDYKITKQQTI